MGPIRSNLDELHKPSQRISIISVTQLQPPVAVSDTVMFRHSAFLHTFSKCVKQHLRVQKIPNHFHILVNLASPSTESCR